MNNLEEIANDLEERLKRIRLDQKQDDWTRKFAASLEADLLRLRALIEKQRQSET